MRAPRALWLLKRTAALLAVGLLTFLAIRVWDSQRGARALAHLRAGSATETTRPLDLTYPPEVFSCRTSPYRSRPATAYTA